MQRLLFPAAGGGGQPPQYVEGNTVMPTIPNREFTPSGSSRGVPSCSGTTGNAKQRTPAMTGRINSVRLCMVPLLSYIRR